MSKQHIELLIPPKALASSEAREVLRAWVADGSLHVSVETGVWKEAGAWGVVLADIVKHLMVAYGQAYGADYETSANAILSTLYDSLGTEDAGDNPSGGLVQT